METYVIINGMIYKEQAWLPAEGEDGQVTSK